MNHNIIGYIVYLLITAVIIYKVGFICYNNGNVFIRHLLKKDIELSIQINKALLVGYYLLNIGYSTVTIVTWEEIESSKTLLEIIINKISIIIIIISLMHYLNLFLINKLIHKLL